MMALKELLNIATSRLMQHSSSPRLDAELLLCHVMEKPRSFIYAQPEHVISETHINQLNELIQRREAGEPVAHLTGTREFWSLELAVTTDTLIPRPETECLVEQALTHIPASGPCRIADLGTGSGAIAIALAHERPQSQFVATDISPAALSVASANAKRHQLTNIEFTAGHWLEDIQTLFDIIVSNPPYIREDDPHLQQDGLMFEPPTALVANDDGMAAIKIIAAQARQHLKPGGWLLIEHGFDQQPAVLDCLKQFNYVAISGIKDLSGQDRLVECQMRS